MEKQIEIGNVKEDGSIINPFEMPGARGGGSDTGFAGTKGSQQRASESDTAGSETQQTTPDFGPDDRVDGPSQDGAPTGDSSQADADSAGGSSSFSPFNTGGLASKPKPKKTVAKTNKNAGKKYLHNL